MIVALNVTDKTFDCLEKIDSGSWGTPLSMLGATTIFLSVILGYIFGGFVSTIQNKYMYI